MPDLRAMQSAVSDACRGVTPIRPSSAAGYPWADVGVAANYRVGLALATPKLELAEGSIPTVAANALDGGGIDAWESAREAVQEFLDAHRQRCVEAGLPNQRPDSEAERQLARDTYAVGLLETVARIGLDQRSPVVADGNPVTVEKLEGLAPAPVVDDLIALASVAHDVLAPAIAGRSQVHVGPVFSGSYDVGGGADADVIADGMLIETKATVKATMRREWCYQLLGYALLDFEDEFAIEEVVFFLPRQRQLLTWHLTELLREVTRGRSQTMGDLRGELRSFLNASPRTL